jgi:hypothetical protein
MTAIPRLDLEDRRRFLENRAQYSLDDLARLAGCWVAWSADCTRLVAVAERPEILDDLVRQAREEPEHCIVEGIPTEDATIGPLKLIG